ncbi:TIGR02444 family protein [Pseudohongiella sp.]|uniref:TIGR02444 family protein n=1 Tax=marine sediment metagenome TaxID=412755 RepID=A0A0F9YJ26_9ZZZZ|nr:TIGR02444 family protein [Pseudohongiella sp.]HDZ09408.1 TIGR02444 family protein [Pseudohongiella sp.]HEA63337.1 TIGR02444 family protein [Pseudohongiella sp.]
MTAPDPQQQPDLLHFARDVYARPGITALCLRLQDEYDVDVVLLLMCCWHGCYHGVLSETGFAQASAFSRHWREQLVRPLRQARRWLKPHPADTAGIAGADQESLRERIKALELDTEFMQLRALAGLVTAAPAGKSAATDNDASTAIRRNLALYAREHNLSTALDESTVSLLSQASLAL